MSSYLGIHEFGSSSSSWELPNYPETICKVIVNEETAHDAHEFLSKRLSAIKNQRSTGEMEDLALVIGTFFSVLPQLRSVFTSLLRWQEFDIRVGKRAIQDIPGACCHVQSRHLLLVICALFSFPPQRVYIIFICRSSVSVTKGTCCQTCKEESKGHSSGHRRWRKRCWYDTSGACWCRHLWC